MGRRPGRLCLASAVLAGAISLTPTACGARTGLPLDDEAAPEADAGPAATEAPVCAVFTGSAQLAPLDVFMMLDTSGSMQLSTPAGGSKLRAVGAALTLFFLDQDSAGIGVALDYYPARQPFIQEFCLTDADCEMPGSCRQTTAGVGCGDLPQACTCINREGCNPVAYRTPAIGPIGLPGAADALIDNFNSEAVPGGATPTRAALGGAIQQALGWLAEEPGHEAVVVLATDGIPTTCDAGSVGDADDPLLVADVAAQGLAAGVRTFVIGVFAEQDATLARESLDAVAQAGGSEQAFLATTSSVSDGFVEALNQVRLDARACELSVPIDAAFDPDSVWVRLEPRDGESLWLRKLPADEPCGPAGGFHLAPLSPGARRAEITLCEASCAVLGASPRRRAEVHTSCVDPRG